jgi:hypothetical protein
MKKILAGLFASLIVAASGLVAAAPPAEAAVGYSPCRIAVNSWGGSASVKCDYGSYRIGVYCSWWTGGSTTRNSAWSVRAPKLAVAYCPFGSRIVNAGAFWSDGRLIQFWK